MKDLIRLLSGVLVVGLLIACGCGPAGQNAPRQADRKPAEPVAPAKPAELQPPEAAVQAAIEAFNSNQPDLIWKQLPAGYQKDLNNLVHQFGRNMDAELWGQLFHTLGGISDVVETKAEFIVTHPIVKSSQRIDADELAKHWPDISEFLKTTVKSDVANLKKLQSADVGEYLSTTGRRAMEKFSAFAASRFAGAKTETLTRSATTAVVRVTFPTASDAQKADRLLRPLSQPRESTQPPSAAAAREVTLTLVEGRWMPTPIVEGWNQRMAAANQQLAALSPDFFAFFKQQWLPMLGAIDAVTANLRAADTAEKFAEVVQNQIVTPFRPLLSMFLPGELDAAPPAATTAAEPASTEGEIVTVVFESGLNEASERAVSHGLMSAVDNPDLGLAVPTTDDSGMTRIAVSPVRDIRAFARKINFARVVKVDAEQRTITVERGSGEPPAKEKQ